MRFKFFVLLIANVTLASSAPAGAPQRAKIPRIGFVVGSGDAKNPGLQVEGFQKGLRDLGYADGKNLVIEYRYAEGNNERFPSLVSELVRLKVDVLIVSALPAILAAKKTTKAIPIVMMINTDPVAAGIVDSLARAGWKYHWAHPAEPRARRQTFGTTQRSGTQDNSGRSPLANQLRGFGCRF